MSRKVYTYTDLSRIRENKDIRQLLSYPVIAVSVDMRMSLINALSRGGGDNGDASVGKLHITEFKNIASAVNSFWSTDQAKFNEIILLSEFLHKKLAQTRDIKEQTWLNGCLRNIDSMMSSINLLVEAEIEPDQLDTSDDRNLKLLADAWRYMAERESLIDTYKKKLSALTTREAWEEVFCKAYQDTGLSGSAAIVICGFYYITPIQERIMQLLEQAGFELIYLIPYDERYPFVYEIWDKTYSQANGYDPKSAWKMDRLGAYDPYGMIFEGKEHVTVDNRLEVKEYGSVMEFVDDVKNIKDDGFTLYTADQRGANELLKDYFPDEYGERKVLAYPIGQFISCLNKMWDDEKQTISLDEDSLIDCFSSGWLSVGGIAGKQYMQDLMHVMPFFASCRTIDEWEKRIDELKKIRNDVISPFQGEHDVDPAVSRWQEAIENPFDNFGMFAVDTEKLDVILTLIKQLLNMARELFGNGNVIKVNEHLRRLDGILHKNEISDEIYDEERKIIDDIFTKLEQSDDYVAECAPSDIARALNLYIGGRLDDGEIEINKMSLVRSLSSVESEMFIGRGKAHICICDVDTTPGGNKQYVWPLTKDKIVKCYETTHNHLIKNLIQIMDSTVLCNRYFMYVGLKNKEVCISWISELNGKMLAPSPYIKLIGNAAGVEPLEARKKEITFYRVADTAYGAGKIEDYEKGKQPRRIIKEARMAYALCPMKYVLGYVVDKYPTYESDFQQNYAVNALISAVYNLMRDQGVTVDRVYKNVIDLFPSLRKGEKRQVYDYISYEQDEENADYSSRSECGGRFYTDERLRLHYPNQYVREVTKKRFGKLTTPDGRMELDLNEKPQAGLTEMAGETDPVKLACTYCPHNSYCRNAVYAVDLEKDHDR